MNNQLQRINFKDNFNEHFPGHYDPSLDIEECPSIGSLDLNFETLSNDIIDICKNHNPQDPEKGWSYYFDDGKVKQDVINSRPKSFQKMFEVWQDCNWTLENSCFYELHDEELLDWYPRIMDAYQNKYGEHKHVQIRVFVKPPMTALGLHCDTYNSYSRKYNVDVKDIFRAFTLVEDWQWGHYVLLGNQVIHQYTAGDSYQIKPNVLHCVANNGFDPQITMNFTGVKV